MLWWLKNGAALLPRIAEIAQLVEHFPEEEGVAGSSPALGTNTEEPEAPALGFSCFVSKASSLRSLRQMQ